MIIFFQKHLKVICQTSKMQLMVSSMLFLEESIYIFIHDFSKHELRR